MNQSLLQKTERLMQAYQAGLLGGQKMPEHENPRLDRNSKENYMYFTLPMALNYQRNSYVLWECASRMYGDSEGRKLYDSAYVVKADYDEFREILVGFKVALQPNKQPEIWKRICVSVEEELDGDIRNLFRRNNYRVKEIKDYLSRNKKMFPYLCGNKICNYWLYVIEQYTDCIFSDRENITVAPDTHVIQASVKLGVITKQESQRSDVQSVTASRWRDLLRGTKWVPIDLHTPLWLWSRGGFSTEI